LRHVDNNRSRWTNISAHPDIVKDAATNPIARRPSARQKTVEIQRRTWLDRGTLPVRQIVQCDPFGNGSALNAKRMVVKFCIFLGDARLR